MNLATNQSTDPSYLFAALSLTPEPVFVTDRRGRIVFFNESASNLLGFSSEEAVGSSCAGKLQGCDTFGNRYCSEHCPITEMAMRNEVVRHFNLKLRTKDKNHVAVDITILNISMQATQSFFLVHILKPAEVAHSEEEYPLQPAPRPPIALVRETLDARVRKLTHREVEVLRMMAGGLSTQDIAARLHISPVTARNHIQNILEKIEVHSKAEAVAFAFQKKIV